jgi:hypothetical protein
MYQAHRDSRWGLVVEEGTMGARGGGLVATHILSSLLVAGLS